MRASVGRHFLIGSHNVLLFFMCVCVFSFFRFLMSVLFRSADPLQQPSYLRVQEERRIKNKA